jgi:hypothetical protein
MKKKLPDKGGQMTCTVECSGNDSVSMDEEKAFA